ncbi:hypothetical protein [Saccharopolyspora gloriosae]|uniref:hypothetical protein n=1 Tax=Saccharopolyspora gloriosae TaxID=455344 RepID=UPI001FB7BF78|nr:hypothetical protein [Saccharopolyspora gloriosae]
MTGRSGYLVNAATTLHCPHGGRVLAAAASASVRADGQPVRTTGDTFAVVGCPRTAGGDPCVSVRWTPDRDAVRIDGVPVLLDSTDGQCFSADLRPQGAPVSRVDGQGVRCR